MAQTITKLRKAVPLASTGAGGFVVFMQQFASTSVSPVDVLLIPDIMMTFPCVFTVVPSPIAFGDGTPLAVMGNKSYVLCNMPAFLAAAGLPPRPVRLYETRALPAALSIGPPVVPVMCVNGVGVPATEKLIYPGGGLDAAPKVVYGDNDGVMNLASILALDTVIGGDPRLEYYDSVKIANTSHLDVVSDDLAVERLVGEILYAARYA